jgi:hypothetical protein
VRRTKNCCRFLYRLTYQRGPNGSRLQAGHLPIGVQTPVDLPVRTMRQYFKILWSVIVADFVQVVHDLRVFRICSA